MAKDPKGRSEPGYSRHVFVCGHERSEGASRPSCATKDSMAMMKQLKSAVKAEGIQGVRVQKAGCLDFCENGVSCVVYPEGTWYSIQSVEDVEAILASLRDGTVAPCVMNLD